MPVQVKGQVLDNRRVGAYQVLSLTAPGIAELTRPGHFVRAFMHSDVWQHWESTA